MVPASTPQWETFSLGPYVVPRLWTGLWQLSSTAWGNASASKIRQGMARYVDQGYTAFGTCPCGSPLTMILRVVFTIADMVSFSHSFCSVK